MEDFTFLQRVTLIDSSDAVILREVTAFLPQQHIHLGACALI